MANENETEPPAKPARTKRALQAAKESVTPERGLLGAIVTAVLTVGGVLDKRFDELRSEAREEHAAQTTRIEKLETRIGSKVDKTNAAIAELKVKTEVAEKTRAYEAALVDRRLNALEEKTSK